MATSPRGGNSAGVGSSTSLLTGAVGGVVAFVVTYGILFVMKSGEAANALSSATGLGSAGISPPSEFQVIGWLFFESHNVATEATVSMMGQSQTQASNIQNSPLWEGWFIVVPVVVLLIAGFAVAYIAESWNAATGATAGGSLVIGYGLLSIVGLFLFKWSVSAQGASISVGPPLVTGLILAGIVYPVVLGAIGGAIGGEVSA